MSNMLSAIFTKSPVAISVSRSSDGRIVDVNERWTLLTGYPREAVLGKTSLEIGMWSSAEEREATREAARRIQEGYSTQLPFKRRDGVSIVIRVEGATVDIDGEPHFVVYVSDVTEERNAHLAIANSERALQQAHDDLLAQVELFGLTESLAKVGHWNASQVDQSLQWSPGMCDLAGIAHDQKITTKLARGMIVPEDIPAFLAARARMDGEPLEYRGVLNDGKLHWLRSRMRRHTRSDGTYVDFGVVQDFTAEHEAEQALHDRFNQVQLLTSRLPEMVFQFLMFDTTKGQFTFVSDAVGTIFGVTPEQACKNPNSVFRWIHPDDLPGMVLSMNQSAQHGVTWSHEFRIRLADGTVRTLFGKAITVRESSGQLNAYGSVTDVSDHKASQVSLRESEERFRALTELSSDWYWEQDENFRFVRFEGGLVKKAGKTGFDSLGKTRWEVGAMNMTPEDWAAHRALLESHAKFRDFELQEIDYKGRPYWMSLSGAPIFDGEGRFKGYRGLGSNITNRKLAEAKIERLAFYDVLTGLPNRRMLVDRLQLAIAASGRDMSPGALLFIDLDNFKDLNDTQGHDVGDKLLQQVAQRLLGCVREVDTVARLGGDEFVVMLQDLDADMPVATAQVELVGKKIIASLNQMYLLDTLEHHSTPSIGIALFDNQHQTVDELLKQADLAMYESKASGRNTLRFFDPAMQALVAQRTALEVDLRNGLQRHELMVYYQPVVDVRGAPIGVEALVRWLHPQRGMVSPADFIPMAEQTGLILPLGQWVLNTACRQLFQWSTMRHTSHLTIAVNVSARQFRHPDFVQQICDVVNQTGANPQRLKLELTESLLLSDTQEAVHKMTQLRAFGVRFSLDDFGTGYSSLSYLKVLPLEQLKIDQSFVRDVLSDANDAAIARTILALGHSLGLNVVAEGVETAGQRDFLLENGCTLFQGYLFGRPVPVDQLEFN